MTSYDHVYNRFLNRITDFNLAELDDYTLIDMLKGWLHSSIVKVRTSSILSADDEIEVFNNDIFSSNLSRYQPSIFSLASGINVPIAPNAREATKIVASITIKLI